MLLSHKFKFIFIRTQKTAGTSIELSLARYCGPDDIITDTSLPEDREIRKELNIIPRNYMVPLKKYRGKEWFRWLRGWRLKYWDHISAKHIKRFVGEEIFNSYYKFCFERNPWDKTLSYFYWVNRNNKYSSFDEFLEKDPLCSDFHRYTIEGRVAVDFIGRYENLPQDLHQVCQKLNIPFDGWMPRAKGDYRKDRRRYQDIMTKSHRDVIAQVFSREIELLGYTYEDGKP